MIDAITAQRDLKHPQAAVDLDGFPGEELARCEARKRTVSATSSGVPSRLHGVRSTVVRRPSGVLNTS